MTEFEFNTVCIVVFVLVVIGVGTGFTYYYKWFKRDIGTKPTAEQLAHRHRELEARFKRMHPDAESEDTVEA